MMVGLGPKLSLLAIRNGKKTISVEKVPKVIKSCSTTTKRTSVFLRSIHLLVIFVPGPFSTQSSVNFTIFPDLRPPLALG